MVRQIDWIKIIDEGTCGKLLSSDNLNHVISFLKSSM